MWGIMKNDTRSEKYVNYDKHYHRLWSLSYIGALIDRVVKDQSME